MKPASLLCAPGREWVWHTVLGFLSAKTLRCAEAACRAWLEGSESASDAWSAHCVRLRVLDEAAARRWRPHVSWRALWRNCAHVRFPPAHHGGWMAVAGGGAHHRGPHGGPGDGARDAAAAGGGPRPATPLDEASSLRLLLTLTRADLQPLPSQPWVGLPANLFPWCAGVFARSNTRSGGGEAEPPPVSRAFECAVGAEAEAPDEPPDAA